MNKKYNSWYLFLFFFVSTVLIPPTFASAARNNDGCALQLTTTPSTYTVQNGGEIVYTYTTKNIGTGICAETRLSLYYSENEKFIQASIAPTASNYYWYIGKLTRGQSHKVLVTIQHSQHDDTPLLGEACVTANNATDSCTSYPVAIEAAPSTPTETQTAPATSETTVALSPQLQPLTTSCFPYTTAAKTNEPVTWTSVTSGGVAPYTYAWYGTDTLTSSAPLVTKSYTTAGVKSASLTVADASGMLLTKACTNTVTVSSPTTPPPMTSTTQIQAWIYPGNPACSAASEYSDGRHIDTLKPEYYTVQTNGTLRQLTTAADGCNGYSAANVADIKKHSTSQYVTVSGITKNTRVLLASAVLQENAIASLTKFVIATGFTGVELDWEGFGDWTATDYTNFKKFTAALQKSLRAQGKKLIIDAPAISDPTYQSYFLFKYEDFTDIDYIAIMAYDYQYDYGVGVPVAPDFWLKNTINWAKARLPIDKIIIGLPAYGYHGTLGSYMMTIDTYAQSMTYPGYANRKINSDGEETWMNGSTYYSAQSTATLDKKKQLVESMGIKHISVWHLGGNRWFSN